MRTYKEAVKELGTLKRIGGGLVGIMIGIVDSVMAPDLRCASRATGEFLTGAGLLFRSEERYTLGCKMIRDSIYPDSMYPVRRTA